MNYGRIYSRSPNQFSPPVDFIDGLVGLLSNSKRDYTAYASLTIFQDTLVSGLP